MSRTLARVLLAAGVVAFAVGVILIVVSMQTGAGAAIPIVVSVLGAVLAVGSVYRAFGPLEHKPDGGNPGAPPGFFGDGSDPGPDQ